MELHEAHVSVNARLLSGARNLRSDVVSEAMCEVDTY
jgi:hypothetical protein